MEASLIGIGFGILVQIALFAYGYGKLNQKVSDLPCRRVNPGKCPFPCVETKDGKS